jgi:Uma2 family endonuclease
VFNLFLRGYLAYPLTAVPTTIALAWLNPCDRPCPSQRRSPRHDGLKGDRGDLRNWGSGRNWRDRTHPAFFRGWSFWSWPSRSAIIEGSDRLSSTMVKAQSISSPDVPQEGTHRVVLRGVTWQTYQALLAELGDHRTSRLAYELGVLEITMPSDRHETQTKLLERMVETLTEELDLPMKGFRSTTLNREDLQRGAEPDSCYYIQNVERIAGRTVNLAMDPAPDLILEVDITSPSSRRLNIYQQLGVPEIWRYVDGQVQILQLQSGSYERCEVSPTFPCVSTTVLNQFLQQAETQDDTTFVRSWRKWVRNQI